MSAVRISLCQDCAAKLRTILESDGEAAMAEAIGGTLCARCLAQVPGHRSGAELLTTLKRAVPRMLS